MAAYTFLVRLYQYQDDRLMDVEAVLGANWGGLEGIHEYFYRQFMEGFCERMKEKATINVHTFMHLLESRRRTGPLWSTSTEPFEALYAVIRRCYQSGTRNVPKQILQNFYSRDL